MGWSVMPEVNLTKHIGFQGDFTSLYMRGVVAGEKRLLIAAGCATHSRPDRISLHSFTVKVERCERRASE